MTETTHVRPRRAALFGLILQIVAFGVVLILGYFTDDDLLQDRPWNTASALHQLAWYILGGIPIWLVALLVFRQRELAELEALDLEQLRREKQATGGGEGMFDEGGGAALGFRVAENRLQWMRKWVVPAFSLVTAAYLLIQGWVRWRALPRLESTDWDPLGNVPMGMILLAIVMLFLLFFSRYTSGMGRVPGWQLLRACGSYMLGNAIVAIVLVVCLGAQLYAGVEWWAHWLAYAVPILMMLLGLETLLNFILDIYRPRTPGTEPRAAYDSRLLGLIAEPGGIAHSIAEAMNYQFGFQVSQTWFYQFLQKRILLLFWAGALALWALTWVVIVQPNELAIIELNGRQVDPEHPLGPGLHFKWPWPFATAEKYKTGQLHQIFIGAKTDDVKPPSSNAVILWTDDRHGGEQGKPTSGVEEFNFIVSPLPGGAAETQPTEETGENASEKAVPIHLLRMTMAVQYKILPARLAAFSGNVRNPEELLRNVAWQELIRYNASADVDSLLGEQRTTAGGYLLKKINERIAKYNLGLEVVYVGLQDVHPEKTVAEAFRNVIGAEQDKIAAIRKARIEEEQRLSSAVGSRGKAMALIRALNNIQDYKVQLERALGNAQPQQDWLKRLDALGPQFTALAQARGVLDQARAERDQLEEEVELKLDRSTRQRMAARQKYEEAEKRYQAAAAALEQAAAPLRAEAAQALGQPGAEALWRYAEAQFALAYWNQQLAEQFQGLEGLAAVALAGAQARRWEIETQAAAEVITLTRERSAYMAAPEIYKARRYLQVLADGIRNSRKYFLVFDANMRDIMTRIEAQEQARPDLGDSPIRGDKQ